MYQEFVFGRMAAAVSPTVCIGMCGSSSTDADWNAYIECWRKTIGPSLSASKGCFLIFAPVDGPNAAQRSRLSADPLVAPHMKQTARLALLTESMMIRGAVTAMNWVSGAGATNKTFAPAQLDAALAWLGQAKPLDVPATRATLRSLASKVGLDAHHYFP